MKITKLTSKQKLVNYFGLNLIVPKEVNWIAANSDGELYGFEHKLEQSKGKYEKCTLAGAWVTTPFYCTYLGTVDLEGMDWKNAFVYVGE